MQPRNIIPSPAPQISSESTGTSSNVSSTFKHLFRRHTILPPLLATLEAASQLHQPPRRTRTKTKSSARGRTRGGPRLSTRTASLPCILAQYIKHRTPTHSQPSDPFSLLPPRRTLRLFIDFLPTTFKMCFGSRENDAEGKRSKEIDQIIHRDEKVMARQVKLLLLGTFTPFPQTPTHTSRVRAHYHITPAPAPSRGQPRETNRTNHRRIPAQREIVELKLRSTAEPQWASLEWMEERNAPKNSMLITMCIHRCWREREIHHPQADATHLHQGRLHQERKGGMAGHHLQQHPGQSADDGRCDGGVWHRVWI